MLKARESHELGVLSLDTALAVPAMTHCRFMSEHRFLSHWDVAGQKPYQRYSDFAYGQHISEVVFGFDLHEAKEEKVRKCSNLVRAGRAQWQSHAFCPQSHVDSALCKIFVSIAPKYTRNNYPTNVPRGQPDDHAVWTTR